VALWLGMRILGVVSASGVAGRPQPYTSRLWVSLFIKNLVNLVQDVFTRLRDLVGRTS